MPSDLRTLLHLRNLTEQQLLQGLPGFLRFLLISLRFISVQSSTAHLKHILLVLSRNCLMAVDSALTASRNKFVATEKYQRSPNS